MRSPVRKLSLSRLDAAAIACAMLLSLACLARGAVDDGVIALLLLGCLPILYLALSAGRVMHPALTTIGFILLGSFTLVLLLQQLSLGTDHALWHSAQQATEQSTRATLAQDKAAWVRGVGQFLFLVLIFMIAMAIGSSESSSRLFLQTLLASGTVCLTLTFFIATSNGVPSNSHYYYHHGFVNPNNAASYLGVMLLVALAQGMRYIKHPSRTLSTNLPSIIDNLSIPTMLKGIMLLFSILMILAGLFMTKSRGGLFLTLLCGGWLITMIVLKMRLHSLLRKAFVGIAAIMMLALLAWSFVNFGAMFERKLKSEGLNPHTRLEIFSAVIPMIADHPLLGTGLGSFPGAFQQYRPDNISSDGIIDKAHNSYLEFAAEMGIPALVILMGALGWMGFLLARGVHVRKERYVTPALGLAVWVFAALNSLIDFPLQVAGLAGVFIAIIVVCVSQTDPRFSEPAHSSTSHIRRIRVRKRGNSKPIA